jgi:hypothetical protein
MVEQAKEDIGGLFQGDVFEFGRLKSCHVLLSLQGVDLSSGMSVMDRCGRVGCD